MTDTTATDQTGETPLIEAREISKYFGSVIALVNWFTPKGRKLNLIASRIGAKYCAHNSAESW